MRAADTEFFRYFAVSDRDRQWGLWASGVGATYLSPGWTDYPKQTHPDAYMFRWDQGRVLHEYQALYMLRGGGEFESASAGPRRIEPGTLVLLFPGDWHRYRPDKSTGWDEYWVSFAGRSMDDLVRAEFFSAAEPLLPVGADEKTCQTYRELLDLARLEPIGFQQMVAAAILSVLAHALAAVRRLGTSPHDEDRVRKAKSALEENVEGNVSIAELAAQLHLSPRHLSRLFRRHTQMSLHEFHLQVKMRRAQQLLGAGWTIKEIAGRLGFESPFHLSRMFKKRFGVSPSHWRRGQQPPVPG